VTLDNLAVREDGDDLQAEGGCAELRFGIGVHKGRTSVLDFYVFDEALVFSAQLFGAQP
jgi:hypothetical protein